MIFLYYLLLVKLILICKFLYLLLNILYLVLCLLVKASWQICTSASLSTFTLALLIGIAIVNSTQALFRVFGFFSWWISNTLYTQVDCSNFRLLPLLRVYFGKLCFKLSSLFTAISRWILSAALFTSLSLIWLIAITLVLGILRYCDWWLRWSVWVLILFGILGRGRCLRYSSWIYIFFLSFLGVSIIHEWLIFLFRLSYLIHRLAEELLHFLLILNIMKVCVMLLRSQDVLTLWVRNVSSWFLLAR